MRYDPPAWDAPAEGSEYNSIVTPPPSRSSSRRRTLPDLPVSPIKKVDLSISRTSRNMLKSLENRQPIFNMDDTVSRRSPDEQYSNFRRRLEKRLDTNANSEMALISDRVNGKELYDKVLQLRGYVNRPKHHCKNTRDHSTFRTPAPSFVMQDLDIDQTIEAPRNNTMSEKTSPPRTSHLVEHLLDINLKSYSDIGVGKNYSTKAVGTTPSLRHQGALTRPLSCRNINEATNTYGRHRKQDLSYLRPTTSLNLLDKEATLRPSRSDVTKLVRGLFCDLDDITHKGNVQQGRREQNSESVRNLIHGPRSSSQPRLPARGRSGSANVISLRKSPTKPPPFCSSVNTGDYSQAVHANEQQLIKLVNTQFPHWRVFVRNLLGDSNIENDVAVNFLLEIENRRNSREISRKIQRGSDHHLEEFMGTDEKILNKLRDKLCRGHPSRIQQLRILHQVLRESC